MALEGIWVWTSIRTGNNEAVTNSREGISVEYSKLYAASSSSELPGEDAVCAYESKYILWRNMMYIYSRVFMLLGVGLDRRKHQSVASIVAYSKS